MPNYERLSDSRVTIVGVIPNPRPYAIPEGVITVPVGRDGRLARSERGELQYADRRVLREMARVGEREKGGGMEVNGYGRMSRRLIRNRG